MAGLAVLSARRPIVVATPTTGDADRLHHDLRAFLGDGEVDLFPAWETLPFERVSPTVETMGRRLRTLWRLREPGRAPRGRRGARARARATTRPARDRRRAARRRAWRRVGSERVGRSPRRCRAIAASTRSSIVVKSRCAVRSSTCSRPRATFRFVSIFGATRSIASPSSPSPISGRRSISRRSRSFRVVSCSRPTRSASGPRRSSPSNRGGESSGSVWPRA